MRSRILLFAAVLVAFGASVTHGFHFDDYSVIHGLDWTAWQTRPLTGLSFALNAEISDYAPLWHAASLAAHLATVFLLFELLLCFLPENVALLGAAIFAVHPIQAETVAYVFSRATLFSTLLTVAAALAWVRGRKWWAVALFGLALLCKEDCAAAPLLVLLFERRKAFRKPAPLITMFLLSIADGAHTLWVTRHVAGSGAGFTSGISPVGYLFSEGLAILHYLRLFVIPYGFSIDPEIHLNLLFGCIAWVLVALIVFLTTRSNRLILAGLILLIPSSSIFPLADLAADHRVYLPMTALSAGIALWLARLPRWIGVAIIVALIGISTRRMEVWSSNSKLWTEALDRAPDKLRPRIQLARAVEPTRALGILLDAEKLHPNATDVNTELGRVYLEMGRPDMALSEFGVALARNPHDPRAINNRGAALLALGQEDPAKLDFERALQIDPCFADARRNLGLPPCR